jgi:hypothetical protein
MSGTAQDVSGCAQENRGMKLSLAVYVILATLLASILLLVI